MGSGWQRAPRPSRAAVAPSRFLAKARTTRGGERGGEEPPAPQRRQGMRMAVGSIKMQPPCESPALATAAAVVAADGALRGSPSAREPEREQPPASLRPRLRDLPALLRSGLTLRRKRSAAGGRVSGPALAEWARAARTWSPRPLPWPLRGTPGSWGGGGRDALLPDSAEEGSGTAGF
ncbi:hypothetical protein P7K49_025244 [Saguinus oedipus]|uniref:Uncharacterized protein n=1 Tax=Saguinus oedipus TaxID=9490 RepID=A0ABQ9UHJ1_SAGOE|nr:hypothetical protein P7K49_025244 [Saguinus oedipus]